MKTHIVPHTAIRSDTRLLIALKERKTRRLFDALRRAGFNETFFQPNLDRLIMQSLGLMMEISAMPFIIPSWREGAGR
jgi:hypothetical protein